MNSFKSFVLMTGLVLTPVLNGQYTGFDLTKYKLPDIRTHRLDATIDFSDNLGSQLSRTKWDTSTTKPHSLAGKADLGYYYFRNSERYQGTFTVNTLFNPAYSKTVYTSHDLKDNDLTANLVMSSTNRLYSHNLFFLEVSPGIAFYTDKSRQLDENSYKIETINRMSNTQISANVLVGHGRIEPVEDLRLALYILEELQKSGRIDAAPGEDVIIDMAEVISKIKRKRFFDTRLRKIEELHVIDSFLVANNIISSNDITYFAVLNDNWDYASGPSRETGFTLSAGISNSIYLWRTIYKQTYNTTVFSDIKNFSNNFETGGIINARYAKPLNLYWQTGAGISVFYGIEITRDPLNRESMIYNNDVNVFSTSLNGLIQYLPDSRTSLGLSFTGYYNHSFEIKTLTDLDPDGYRMRASNLSGNLSFDMYYYISPQLRLRVLSSLTGYNSLMKTRYESVLPEDEILSRSFNHILSLTLTYSFF